MQSFPIVFLQLSAFVQHCNSGAGVQAQAPSGGIEVFTLPLSPDLGLGGNMDGSWLALVILVDKGTCELGGFLGAAWSLLQVPGESRAC